MKTYSRKKALLKSFEIDDVCRLCLSKDCDMREIFVHEDVPLPVKIMACISVEVYEGDGMPSQVCIACTHKIEMSYKFKQKCEESDAKLRQFIKSFKNVELKVSSSGDSVRSSNNGKDSSKLEMDELESNIDQNSTTCLEEETYIVETSTEMSQKNYVPTLVISCDEKSCANFPSSEDALLENIQNTLSDPIHGKVVAEKCNEKIHAELCQVKTWDKDINNVNPTQAGNRLQLLNSTSQCSLSQNVSHRQESVYITNMQQNSVSRNCAPSQESKTENIQKLETQLCKIGDKSERNEIDCEPQLNMFSKCDKCPRSFSKRMDLLRHSSVHDEQRGFVCNVCEKWFSNKSNFIRHGRIHTGEKPYSCQYCQKRFAQVANLTRHTMLHTGNKPFKCEICKKAFTQRGSLKFHMRQHSTSIQQYYCPLCEKGFCHQSGLSRHLIVHSGKTFNCNECSKRFTDQSSLRRHIKRGHTNSNCKCTEIVKLKS